ncbi:MAG: Serine/threonine protein kinase PrkC, regulator of stationary phase, partial [Labilithrix sp.]|nr:Serine/threonine protein kinase PrkC, regulator of stationary phase [Labilithrix sp.]
MSALEPGSVLGSYRILARLRAGAMGVLYLARRNGTTGFSRPVAIKVIHDHLAQDKRFVRMFVDEAKLSAFIDDPNVVRVEEFGQAAGRYYLVMEYVDGASLAQVLGVLKRRGHIPVEQAVAIAMQIAGGLHGAHEATDEAGKPLGIVHRDVSPHNVLLSFKGYVRVIDFGIAKARQVGGQTKTGSLRGKIAYMPPEQARSARTVDRRADLYGVGLVLWEMLTLRRVFDADTEIAILNQIRDPQIAPPSSFNPAVPPALDAVVMRTLAQDPDDRPATGTALQRALAEALPAALLVLPGDLAGLMKNVRAAAEALAGGEDDAAQYGDEVKASTGTFAGTLHESVEQANASLGGRASRPDDEAPASAPPPSFVPLPPPPSSRGSIPLPAARPSVPIRVTPRLLPSDGVRALAPSSPPTPASTPGVRAAMQTASAAPP